MQNKNTARALPNQDSRPRGALDKVQTLTRFPSLGAKRMTELQVTLPELVSLIEKTSAADKTKLPMLSGLTWGDIRTEKGSLRHKENARKIHAVFTDYDTGEITPEEAVERLTALGITSIVCTSPSHQMPGKGNRWRLVLPLGAPTSPEKYADLVARANGVFGGALADESFRFAQAYFFGSVKGRNPVKAFIVEGSRFIDVADDLDAMAIGPSRPPSDMLSEVPQEAVDQSEIPEAIARAMNALKWAKARVVEAAEKGHSRTEEIHRQAVHLGGYVACNVLSEEQVREALTEAAEEVGYLAEYEERELERHITNGLKLGMARPLPWHDPVENLPDFGAEGDEREGAIPVEEPEGIEGLEGAPVPALKAKEPPLKVDRVTARLNAKHAIVRHGGKTWVADFVGDRVEFGPVEGLHSLYANDLVPTGRNRAPQPASKIWLNAPGRHQYLGGIVFDPTGRAPKDALNLFTGFAVHPDPNGSCERILAHIRDVVAAGDDTHFRYIIGWLADLVRRPGQKPGVALVLRGGKGVGKDTLAVVMGKIIGRKHVAHIVRPDDLTGRFNAPFATALLVHVEEAFWSGDVSKKGTLQALITAPTQPIERKGVDRIEVDSFLRVLMTTNDEWAVPASEDERRYAVFDVSNAHRRDPNWFGPLYKEIEGDGPAAFLHYLLSVDLSGFDVREVPQTEALRDQKIASLRGVARWWFEVLDRGDPAEFEEFGDWSGPITVEKEAVRSSYAARLRESRFGGDPVNSAIFTKELKRLLGGLLRETRPRVEGKRPCMFALPSLDECRAMFEKWLQDPIAWSADDAGEENDPEADALI